VRRRLLSCFQSRDGSGDEGLRGIRKRVIGVQLALQPLGIVLIKAGDLELAVDKLEVPLRLFLPNPRKRKNSHNPLITKRDFTCKS
jgi:hypothetical protein